MSLLPEGVIKEFVKSSLVSIDDLHQKYFQKWIYITISMLLLYFVLGQVVYQMWGELDGLDALFFTVETFSTVGYGIYAPTTTGLRLFTSFYILLGVGVGSALLGAVNDEINKSENIRKNQEDITNRTVTQLGMIESLRETMRITSIRIDKYIFGESASIPSTPLAALEEDEVYEGDDRLPDRRHMMRRVHGDIEDRPVNRAAMDAQYARMHAVYLQAYNDELAQLRVDTIYSFFIIIFLLVVGSVFFYFTEDWTFDVAFYYCVVTLSTVGYGDVVPTTTLTKSITIVYILVGCGFLAKTLSNIVRYPLVLRNYKNEMRVLNQFGKYLSKERILALSEGDEVLKEFKHLQRTPGEVTKSEFCLSVLHLMNRVDRKHVAIVSSVFDLLDTNRQGVLDRNTLDKLQEVAPTEATILEMVEEANWERINKKNPCLRALYTTISTTAPQSPASSTRQHAHMSSNREVDTYNLFLRAAERKPTMTEAEAANSFFAAKARKMTDESGTGDKRYSSGSSSQVSDTTADNEKKTTRDSKRIDHETKEEGCVISADVSVPSSSVAIGIAGTDDTEEMKTNGLNSPLLANPR